MSIVEEKLKLLPTNPGVYVMLDNEQNIIYVGKAKNLKNRVRQYFFNGVKTDKVIAMVNNIADFYYIITPSEIDALSLENNLIKKHKPKYNILLKDDKTYPYLKIDLKENYPTFTITRKIKKDGSKYFGPFMGGISVKEMLETVNAVFFLRPCTQKLKDNKSLKPCLNYHLKKCLAPCNNGVDKSAYLERVKCAIDFLSGDTENAQAVIKQKMLLASENEEFELALKYKQLLESMQKLKLKRVTSLNKFINADIIAYSNNGIYFAVNLLFVRKGIMLGSKNFSFTAHGNDQEMISSFISGYYTDNADIPEEVITSVSLPDEELLTEYFKQKLGKKVTVLCAKQGVRKQLADMATVNAEEHLVTATTKIMHKEDMTVKACQALKEKLNLKNYPRRMECYDISNISGVDKVGSMVVFMDGEPDRNSYRRFKIDAFEGADDYLSHQLMMERRLNRLLQQDEKFPKPDLIVIDGGKGQLSAVKQVFDKFNVTDIDLISLAEREEEIFTLFSPYPVVLDRRDYSLKMLQRLRDEAHRFAITYHRALRGKRALSSVLDGIEGIGKQKQKALIEKFKDISGIATASLSELLEVKGIGEKQANSIIEKLTKEGLR